MIKKRIFGVVASTLFAVSALAVPAASATTAAAPDATVSIKACSPWSDYRSEGGGSGQMCEGNHATGTIYDAKADGRCVFFKFYYIGGGEPAQSAQVGPAGATKYIDVWAAPGKQFNGEVSAEWRSC
ncbi:hypothetical protein ACIOGZ_12240 [Kitasatospora sp. NPDC088160]|uniref:hypothetical protein n=1 Tax=Kitasatospora sp. NPDC088160 TaxID=3364072 RepID=UPI003817ADBE